MNFTIRDFYKNISNNNKEFEITNFKNSFFNFKSLCNENFLVDSNYIFANILKPLLINYKDSEDSYSYISSFNTNEIQLGASTKINRIHSNNISYNKINNGSSINISSSTFNPVFLNYNEENKFTIFKKSNDNLNDIVNKTLTNSFLLQTSQIDFLKEIDINSDFDTNSGISELAIDNLNIDEFKNLDKDKSFYNFLNENILVEGAILTFKKIGYKYSYNNNLYALTGSIKEIEEAQCFFDVSNYLTIFSETGKAGFEVFEKGSNDAIKFLGNTEGKEKGIIKVYCDKLVDMEVTT